MANWRAVRARGVLVLRTRTVVAGMRVYSRLVVVGGRSNASPGGLMPLDARDGHAAVVRRKCALAFRPVRTTVRGVLRGAIERSLFGLEKKQYR